MENTLNNKKALFSQYLMQKVLKKDIEGLEHFYETPIGFIRGMTNDSPLFLELKHLDNITDQDAWGVGIKVNCWAPWERKKDWFEDDDMKDIHIKGGQAFSRCIGKEFGSGMSHPFANNSTDILHAYDFLRSKGYAMPFMGISVEKQIKYNWIKIKNNENN